MDLQTQMRLQNMFGAPPQLDMPDSGPSSMTTPPIVQPGKDPYANISFGDTNFQPQPLTDNAPPPDDTSFDAGARMRQLYTPHTQSIDQFNQMIQQYPNRADYKPSMWRKIAASLAMFGRGGPQLAEQVIDKPWSDAITDWQNKIKETGAAANMERYQNTNERTMAYQTVAQELRQRAQDLKDKNDSANAAIREHRASIYEFKAMHPNMKMVFPKGGNIMAQDPLTGKLLDTGVPTGSMTDLDKLNLQEENALQNIGARGDEARKTENVKEVNRQADIAARGNESRATVRERASRTGAGAKPETPTQTRVRQFNAARELYNTRPDLRKFITLGRPGSNDFTVASPGKSWFGTATGPNDAQYKEIQKKIYEDTKAGAGMAPVAAHTTVPSEKPTVPAGRVAIYKNGQPVGSVPQNQSEQAKKEGYTLEP